jgi:hypothetical protein
MRCRGPIPHPVETIPTIEIVSNRTACDPLVVAITAERENE